MISLSKFKSLISVQLLNKLAIEYNVNADNHVRLPGQTVFLCLLNGILNHMTLTQRMLEEHYLKLTKNSCDHSSFGKRIASIDAVYFEAISDYLYSKLASLASNKDLQVLNLRIIDATIVTLSAKLLSFGMKANNASNHKKRQVKSVIELSDDGIPNLLHICNENSECSDVKAIGETMKRHNKKGDLWVFDKGCNAHHILLELHQLSSFWITPHSAQKLTILDTLFESDTTLPENAPEDEEQDLIIRKVESAIFSSKWSKVKDLDSMQIVVIHCYRWDKRSKSWKPLILMSNLPLNELKDKAGPYTFHEIADIYRRRWEIEIFFRLIKQYLNYDHLTSRSENGIKVMIHMSMIASLLMIWYKQQTGINRGWRSIKFWLAENVREWTAYSLKHMQLRASP